jgi:dihydrofolate reductase
MRDIVYYVAATADGFIARRDGSFDAFPMDEDFLQALLTEYPETFPAPYRAHLGNTAGNRHFDTVLMGRHTYEVGSKAGLTSPYPTLAQYVVSRTMSGSPDPAVTLLADRVPERIRELQQRDGKDIWLCGGGALAHLLLSEGLLNRLIVKVNPVLIGDGIPLFAGEVSPTRLALVDRREFPSGHMIVTYTVSPTR